MARRPLDGSHHPCPGALYKLAAPWYLWSAWMSFSPLSPPRKSGSTREALLARQKSYYVDLTYTSNAIEGNTLTLRETAELIEHGITVGGKPLRDHLEAVDHYNAVLWVRELAAKTAPIDETTVRELHRRIVFRSQPEIGGIYSALPRRIAGSPVVFPNAVKIPGLMKEYGEWLARAAPEPAASFDAHFRLVAIHPFTACPGGPAWLWHHPGSRPPVRRPL